MKSYPESLLVNAPSALFRHRLRDLWIERLGWVLEKLHSPAKIKEFEYVDATTNKTVYLSTGTRYSVLHVDDKQFFFSRLTGRFDGTGTLLEERVADGLELLD